jgi:hypothetical protein
MARSGTAAFEGTLALPLPDVPVLSGGASGDVYGCTLKFRSVRQRRGTAIDPSALFTRGLRPLPLASAPQERYTLNLPECLECEHSHIL